MTLKRLTITLMSCKVGYVNKIQVEVACFISTHINEQFKCDMSKGKNAEGAVILQCGVLGVWIRSISLSSELDGALQRLVFDSLTGCAPAGLYCVTEVTEKGDTKCLFLPDPELRS